MRNTKKDASFCFYRYMETPLLLILGAAFLYHCFRNR